jgi:hypothetical protein
VPVGRCVERGRERERQREKERGREMHGERERGREVERDGIIEIISRKKEGKINRREESNKSIAEYVGERLWNYSVKSLTYVILIAFIKHNVLSQVREKKTYHIMWCDLLK